jgi:2-iminobutanoate/2-iminopropanoate deaminase
MKIINHQNLPVANGHYSQCIEHLGVLYISGQLPVETSTRQIPEGIEAQARLVLEKLDQILVAAGSSRNKVMQVRIYLSDIEMWDEVNRVYSLFFGEHKPVRCVVPSGKLHYGCLLELEAISHL